MRLTARNRRSSERRIGVLQRLVGSDPEGAIRMAGFLWRAGSKAA
jgi:hypothetical protein